MRDPDQLLEDLLVELGDNKESLTNRLVSASRTKQNPEEIQATVNRFFDVIQTIRIGVKYLIYDLEATRRELMELKGWVEEQSDD